MSSVAATFAGGMQKERREMCVVVKADVQGSAEALTRALRDLKRENDEAIVLVKVLISETGEEVNHSEPEPKRSIHSL